MAKRDTDKVPRRAEKRIKKRIGVNIVCYNKKVTKPKLDEEVGLNIALGGVLVECSKRLARGSLLTLKLMLTYDSKYKIILTPARVVWNKKSSRNTYYIGCKFTRLKAKDKETLTQHLKKTGRKK
ncbi:MAG: PilZ domain-containing protein [Candidatus Omnitrophica bacterium]|nr:PilZ domain-containing protein [Candidatus Omnitrophota bacterium]